MYKIDLLLKCSATPVYQLKTSHQTTLTGLIHFTLPDQTAYLATSSIDKCFGSYKVEVPKPQAPNSPSKVGQMKSLMNAGISRSQWNTQNPGAISQSTSKFLNDYLKERE